MNKQEFFLAAMRGEAWRYRSWIFFCFSVTYNEQPELPEDFAFRVGKDVKGYWTLVDGERVYLDSAGSDKPLFQFKDPIDLKPGDLLNVKKSTKTTYGNVVFNALALVGAFGDKVEFMTGRIDSGAVKKQILHRVIDDPAEGVPPDPTALYTRELIIHATNIGHLSGFGQLCVPSATPRTVSRHPDMVKLRDALLEENKDKLNDPATVAKIDAALIALDKEWIEGDPDKGFYYKSKSFNITRKKMHGMYGAEFNFSGDGGIELIRKSLREGLEIDKIPAMVNTLRDGSYSRGADTALGGVAVQFFQRVFQNAKISQRDCGATLGLPVTIDDQNAGWLGDRFFLDGNTPKAFTPELIKSMHGKSVMVRSPAFCKADVTDFCEICMGTSVSQTPTALSAHAGAVGSMFMGIFMKRMHGRTLTLVNLDVDKMFS